jgi:hypothetical protein
MNYYKISVTGCTFILCEHPHGSQYSPNQSTDRKAVAFAVTCSPVHINTLSHRYQCEPINLNMENYISLSLIHAPVHAHKNGQFSQETVMYPIPNAI